jgi:hypothetical protein
MRMVRLPRCEGLDGDAFSAEDQGIDGPCAWTEHGQAYAQNGEQEVTLVAAWICDRHQQLADPLKPGHDGGPEPETNADSYQNQRDVDFPQRGRRNGQHHLDSLHDQRTTRGKAQQQETNSWLAGGKSGV